jgi:hypothetical protein
MATQTKIKYNYDGIVELKKALLDVANLMLEEFEELQGAVKEVRDETLWIVTIIGLFFYKDKVAINFKDAGEVDDLVERMKQSFEDVLLTTPSHLDVTFYHSVTKDYFTFSLSITSSDTTTVEI